jgi:hypothetical protein
MSAYLCQIANSTKHSFKSRPPVRGRLLPHEHSDPAIAPSDLHKKSLYVTRSLLKTPPPWHMVCQIVGEAV